MTNIAEQIKSAVTMPDVCAMYGFNVNRQNKTVCPFHADKHASLHIYPGRRGFHCFSCGASGDVIRFVQDYFGLDFRGAAEKINQDFSLGLPLDNRPVTAEQKVAIRKATERRQMMERRKDIQNRLEMAYHAALDRYVELDKAMAKNAPDGRSEPSDKYVIACHRLAYAGYLLDSAEAALFRFERMNKNA